MQSFCMAVMQNLTCNRAKIPPAAVQLCNVSKSRKSVKRFTAGLSLHVRKYRTKTKTKILEIFIFKLYKII